MSDPICPHCNARKPLTLPKLAAWTRVQMQLQDGCCWYCGIGLAWKREHFHFIGNGIWAPITGMAFFHVEHQTPKSRGGTDDPSNLVLACAGCNLDKRAKTVEEFRAEFHAELSPYFGDGPHNFYCEPLPGLSKASRWAQ